MGHARRLWAGRHGTRRHDGRWAIAGDGPVRNLDDVHRAAARFADRCGLTVGEVMPLDNGFYAELADPSGTLATEVLIDPSTGDVQIEYGPAMMWNAAYGMHPGGITDDMLTKGTHRSTMEELADLTLTADQVVTS